MENIEFKFAIAHSHAEGSFVRKHKHPCYELVYYFEGNGFNILDGHKFDYCKNSFCLINSNCYHSETHNTKTEVYFVGFQITNPLFPLPQGVYEDLNGEVMKEICNIKSEYIDKAYFYKENIELCLNKILIYIARKRKKTDEKRILDESLEFAADYIRNNCFLDLNVKGIAKSIGYSYDYFRHQFKIKFGVGAKEFILRERIKNIKSYLVNTNKSINEIAQLCAYDRVSTMCIAFKNITGISALEYRKTHKSMEDKVLVDYMENYKERLSIPVICQ